MENKNSSIFYNGLIWGLILAFAGIIYNVILYMIGQNLNQALGYAGILISLVILILAIRGFRDNIRGGVLPFGPAFGFLMVIILVSGVIGTIYTYILWTVIDPEIISKMMDMQMEKIMDRGVPEEALDQAMAITSKFMKPGVMAAMGFGTQVLVGAILALIIGAIFKRDEDYQDPIVEEDTEE